MALVIVHLELEELNELVERFHRHHKRVQGHRFSLGAWNNNSGVLVGGCSVGRPVSRIAARNNPLLVEVTRLVTDGTKNACSFLYGAAARASKTLGYNHIQTYILDSETGITLKAAGWSLEGISQGGSWTRENRARREDQPKERKQRWGKPL